MVTTFHLPADELNLSVLKSIKEAFKGKNIEIIVSEVDESGAEEILAERISNIRANKNTICFTEDDFFTTYRKK